MHYLVVFVLLSVHLKCFCYCVLETMDQVKQINPSLASTSDLKRKNESQGRVCKYPKSSGTVKATKTAGSGLSLKTHGSVPPRSGSNAMASGAGSTRAKVNGSVKTARSSSLTTKSTGSNKNSVAKQSNKNPGASQEAKNVGMDQPAKTLNNKQSETKRGSHLPRSEPNIGDQYTPSPQMDLELVSALKSISSSCSSERIEIESVLAEDNCLYINEVQSPLGLGAAAENNKDTQGMDKGEPSNSNNCTTTGDEITDGNVALNTPNQANEEKETSPNGNEKSNDLDKSASMKTGPKDKSIEGCAKKLMNVRINIVVAEIDMILILAKTNPLITLRKNIAGLCDKIAELGDDMNKLNQNVAKDV